MTDEQPVHFPTDPDKFQFDESVAEIFPNMAERAIPLYREMHKLHAKILLDDYEEKMRWPPASTYTVLDIGASRAEFYQAIAAEAQRRDLSYLNIQYIPCDQSDAMIEATAKASRMRVHKYDLADPLDSSFDGHRFDAVCMHYVMQFIPLDWRGLAYERLSNFVKPEGLLFYGEKETLRSINWWSDKEKRIADSATSFYMDFRAEAGYSREEIEAKTKALQNSMWEVAYESDTSRNLEMLGFSRLIPTTRLGLFHSFVAIRGKG